MFEYMKDRGPKGIAIDALLMAVVYLIGFVCISGALGSVASILLIAGQIAGWPFGTETEPTFYEQWIKGMRVCLAIGFLAGFIVTYCVYTHESDPDDES